VKWITNIGSETWRRSFYRGIGSQLNHARNDLDALIVNTEIKGFMTGGKTNWNGELNIPVNHSG
jgi:hypothetical protein